MLRQEIILINLCIPHGEYCISESPIFIKSYPAQVLLYVIFMTMIMRMTTTVMMMTMMMKFDREVHARNFTIFICHSHG